MFLSWLLLPRLLSSRGCAGLIFALPALTREKNFKCLGLEKQQEAHSRGVNGAAYTAKIVAERTGECVASRSYLGAHPRQPPPPRRSEKQRDQLWRPKSRRHRQRRIQHSPLQPGACSRTSALWLQDGQRRVPTPLHRHVHHIIRLAAPSYS